MIIKELWLTHFGKFHDYHIELGPSMNIIFGDNEAGKSTVYYFIEAMFFGARRLRGRAAASDMYSRFRPWEGNHGYEGTMIFEHGGMTYRLYRNFYKAEASVRLICLDTNKEIPLPDGTLESLIDHLTEENFENTVGVAQTHSHMSRSFARSLQTQAANLAMTGSSRLRLDRALDSLEKERRRLRREDFSGELEALEKKEDYCRQELDDVRQRLEMIENDLERFTEDDLKRKAAQSKKALEDCQMALGALAEKLSGAKAAPAGEAKVPLPSGGRKSADRPAPSSGAPLGLCVVMFIAGILAGVILAKVHGHIPLPALRLGLVATAFLLVFGLAGMVRGILRRKGHRFRPSLDGAEEGHPMPPGDLENFRRLEEKKRGLEQRHKTCLQALEKYRQMKERRAWEQEQYSRISNGLEDVIEEERRLRDRIRDRKREELCVDTARKILEDLGGEIHESFGKPLADQASRLMARISGVERTFVINEKLEMMVDNSREFVPVSRLSEGTLEQLYLAVRLGAAKLLFHEECVPLILDDTFAFYDDRRLETILSWFASQYSGQVILLTCQHREWDMLDRLDEDYNYVNLDQ